MIIARLGAIKKNRESVFGSFTLAADIDWLIEQAEENAKLSAEIMRVHMYEKQYKDLLGFASSVEEKQEKEIARLWDALVRIYGILPIDGPSVEAHKIAKSALEETK